MQFKVLLDFLQQNAQSQINETFSLFERALQNKQQELFEDDEYEIDSEEKALPETTSLVAVNPIEFSEFISKVAFLFPSSIVLFSTYQVNQKSFVDWFINDFIYSELVGIYVTKKKVKKIYDQWSGTYYSDSDENVEVDNKLKNLHQHVHSILNNLTGYNNLMSFNQRVIKHEFRAKFMLKSLLELQKIIKRGKEGKDDDPVTTRMKIMSNLLVVDSLSNFQNKSMSDQKNYISLENYYNSIRILVARNQILPGTKFPLSFITTLQMLLNSQIDVKSAQNS